jgi:hypothetical protein
VRRDTQMSMESRTGASARGRFEPVLDQMAGPWWMFLVTGIAWLVISLISVIPSM